MGVASWLLILLGLLMGPGQSGVLALTEGWVTVPSCTVVWVVGCLVLGVEDTLTAGGLLRLLWSWWSAGWWVPLCVLGACGGGMLSGFWGSAPWVAWLVFCCLLWVVGCGCGWVGCELYSGREHLTVRFL